MDHSERLSVQVQRLQRIAKALDPFLTSRPNASRPRQGAWMQLRVILMRRAWG